MIMAPVTVAVESLTAPADAITADSSNSQYRLSRRRRSGPSKNTWPRICSMSPAVLTRPVLSGGVTGPGRGSEDGQQRGLPVIVVSGILKTARGGPPPRSFRPASWRPRQRRLPPER
jgi:hypothetical protein